MWSGQVSAAASEECGLAAGTPVVAGGADNACAAVGTGGDRAGPPDGLDRHLGHHGGADGVTPEVDPGGRAHTFCHAVPDTWYVMGVMLSAGGALRWFRDAWCQAEVEQARARGARRLRRADGDGRRRRRPAPKGCSSCRTSRASALPTATRMRAASSAA